MNGLTLRIDCDPAVIPAAAYEWDIRYRHLIALTVLDCGDHLEFIGEPYAPMKDAEARWDESWREAFEDAHSNLRWETGITPMKVGETARVTRTVRVESPARLTGHDMHVVTRQAIEESVTVRDAEAWQPGGYFDGFYDPTIELPTVRILPLALDNDYPRGVGKWASEKLATSVPASVFLAAAYGLERHGGVMAHSHKARPVWKPLGTDEHALVLAVVGKLSLMGGETSVAPTEENFAEPEYAWPTSVAAAQELGLTSMKHADTFRLFIAALEAERFGMPDEPRFEKVGDKWVVVRHDNKWAWQLANQVARRFESNPKAFVEWVYWNRSALLEAAEELVATPVVDAKPKTKKRATNSIVSFATSPITTEFDALPQFRGVAFHGGHTLASQALLAANGGDIRKTLTEMQEEITQTGTNR